ncbi:MAG: CapA family protein [Acidobacteria bacterium]|nr:CapA family protein [Acidobacteriota bacterium]
MNRERIRFVIGLILGLSLILIAVNYKNIYYYLLSKTKPAPISKKTLSKIPEIKLKETSVSFIAVGDIMMSRGVNNVIARTSDPLRPFSLMADLLNSTDFNFGNLESPISGSDKPGPAHSLVFNTPIKNVEGLEKYNFKVLNLANNHALDQGVKGLENTRKVLVEKNITYLGVGENLDEAWKPKVVTFNGLKIGFLGASYASVNDGGVSRNDLVARIEDTEYLKNSLAELKKISDFIVVTMHAGVEYTRKPHQPQIDFARSAIDYGADIVIGAHPHWIQLVEKYKDKYIFYSLGNFIFDQAWSQDTKEGLVLKIFLTGYQALAEPASTIPINKPPTKITKVELIPIVIENYSTPRPANQVEKSKILEKINFTDDVLTQDSVLSAIP